MSSTEHHDAQRPTVGLPTRTRPPQPAPNRPVPEVVATEAGQIPGQTQVPMPEPAPARKRSLWPAKAGADDEHVGSLEPAGSGRRRTTSFSASESRPKVGQPELAATLSGLVFVLAGCLAWLVSRQGWELSLPDEDERLKMTDPIASIALRHTATDWLNADVLDVISASVAVTSYAQTKPLTRVEADTSEAFAADDDLTPAPPAGSYR